MKILITGADGFLGRAVMRALEPHGWQLVPVTRRQTGTGVRCDLSDPAAVSVLLADTRPSAIVNLAAIADFSDGALPRLYSVNTLCPAIFAEWCKRQDAHLVQASMAIHGRGAGTFSVRHPGMPETDYGRSKWLAEQAILASACRAAIVRIAGIFGRGGPSHLGLNRAIDGARAGQVPTLVGSGLARRNYIYVDDAAAGMVTCVMRGLTGVFYAGGEPRSLRDMLQSVCDVWLPGRAPMQRDGGDAEDQLVEVSPELGPVRSFVDGLDACR